MFMLTKKKKKKKQSVPKVWMQYRITEEKGFCKENPAALRKEVKVKETVWRFMY